LAARLRPSSAACAHALVTSERTPAGDPLVGAANGRHSGPAYWPPAVVCRGQGFDARHAGSRHGSGCSGASSGPLLAAGLHHPGSLGASGGPYYSPSSLSSDV